MIGPCGTLPLANEMPHVTIWFENCQPTKTFHVTSILSYSPATSACTDCTDYTVNIIFLPVWLDEHIAISLTPDVRLRRNELHRVRNDEVYSLIQFEVILGTLNFWAKFDPLITSLLGGGFAGEGGMPLGTVESVLTRKTWAVLGLLSRERVGSTDDWIGSTNGGLG